MYSALYRPLGHKLSKMKRLLLLSVIATLLTTGCKQDNDSSPTYIDKDRPSLIPQVFARSFISQDSISEFGSVFNKDMNEFYFAIDSGGHASIKCTQYKNGEWTTPRTILTNSNYGLNDPFLSNDENRLYYISDKPRNEQDTIPDYDIWYSQRSDKGWSTPINAGLEINSDDDEYYISFTNDGAMYFASNHNATTGRKHDFDIYKSEYISGKYQTPTKLSEAINSRRYEADVFVSPDESYIIFCSARKSGLGRGDLYISFQDTTGHWTEAITMGQSINTQHHEFCPFVSKDGKYFFYTSNQDIYWVSTEIIDRLREKVKLKH